MWLQATLTVDKTRAPLLELLFENLGADAITLNDAGDEPMLEPGPGETPLWAATHVTGLFAGGSDADALRSAINRALNDDVSRYLRINYLEDREWSRTWLERFKPMRFGRRLWIRPGDQAIPQRNPVIVDLDPGLAFGTGTHPTTALCLRWLDDHDLHGYRVIDFGCGSGVLAIAALKLGADHAVGVDHDPQAHLATRENAERNGVAARLTLVPVEGTPANGQADLVLANILANVIVVLAGQLCALARPGGHLVLSGVLPEQVDAVSAAFGERVGFTPPVTLDGWTLLHGVVRP